MNLYTWLLWRQPVNARQRWGDFDYSITPDADLARVVDNRHFIAGGFTWMLAGRLADPRSERIPPGGYYFARCRAPKARRLRWRRCPPEAYTGRVA